MPRSSPSVISLYTGAGGLDLGFEAAGFTTRVAVESGPAACRTLRANRPDWPVIESDIHGVASAAILKAAGLRVAEADVLIGGPPCQPFSKSGYWTPTGALRLDDPRADTLTAYLRVLQDARPRAFLVENVDGLVYEGKDEGMTHLLDGIAAINRATGTDYRPRWRILNAADYGVPQIRRRVFLVGSRDGARFAFPDATHSASSQIELFRRTEPYRTAWDAIGDLPQDPDDACLDVGGKWADLVPSIPEGRNYLWHTDRGGGIPLFPWRKPYWTFLLKLAKDRPSWTIQARMGTATGPLHWRSRRLTVAEIARLQTFPEGLLFEGGDTAARKMLGNAVPSLLAEVLAREIRTQLLGGAEDAEPLKLMPPARSDPPPPEPVEQVPTRYLQMTGVE